MLLVLLVGCTSAVSERAAGFAVTNLRTEYMENPLGLDKLRPRFTWELKVRVHITPVGVSLTRAASLVRWCTS